MGRTPCCDKSGLKKGPWTLEEDQKLINYIQSHGPGNWRTLPKNAGLERCGKSCRLRWTNYLRPDIKRGRFSFEEEETIIQLHSIIGNKWSAIAARLPGRTDNEIKNYWNTHIRKRLLKMGIDPVTHAPRLDLDLSSILSSALCNPSLLNMSNLIGTQVLINPEWLKLVSNFMSLKTENSELFSENLQHTQLGNTSQLQSQFPSLQNISNQFQKPTDEALNMEGLLSNMSAFSSEMSSLQENSMASYLSESYVPHENYAGLLGNPSLQDQDNYINHNRSNDSVLSTPLSSPTPLNSSSTQVNRTTEDERDSYCSNLFKFGIPDSLDISDLL